MSSSEALPDLRNYAVSQFRTIFSNLRYVSQVNGRAGSQFVPFMSFLLKIPYEQVFLCTSGVLDFIIPRMFHKYLFF
jgi:hypothetical protein